MSRMRTICRGRLLAGFVSAALVMGVMSAAVEADQSRPGQEFAQKASWKVPTPQAVRELAIEWLATREVDAAVRTQLEAMWASATSEGADAPLLDVLCATFGAADPQAQKLVDTCSQPRREIALPDAAWLRDEKSSPLVRHNLRLAYGRWLVQESLYDEAAVQFAELKPADVVDPAALLFYQAVVHHRTLARDPGLAAISLLLENEATIPKRFVSLARLMQADLDALKDESLDHIARRMDDIRRRLDLGRAGPKVREVENGVIASLDKLIEQLEQQQQAAEQQVAEPVGHDGQRDHLCHGGRLQPDAAVQAQLERQRTDQRAEIQIEGIADRRDAERARHAHRMPCRVPADQVVARDERVAHERQAGGQQQLARALLLQRLPHRRPVDAADLARQQREHQQRERPWRSLLDSDPQAGPAGPRAQRRQRLHCARVCSRSTRGVRRGSHFNQTGKRRRK